MRKFWIIAGDVYQKNVKSWAFLIMILIPVVLSGALYLVGDFAADNNEAEKIGVYSENEAVAQALAETKKSDFQFKVIPSKQAGEKALKKESISALLELTVTDEKVSGKLLSATSLGQNSELSLQQLLSGMQTSTRAQALGLDPTQVASLNQPAELTKQKISFDDNGKMQTGDDNSTLQSIVSYVVTIILFIFILTYAQIIAQEIASEKGTRIMEVLLSSTRAQTHFYGKLVGVLLVALTQLAIYTVFFGLGFQQLKNIPMVKDVLGSIDVGQLFGPFLVYTIIFTLLGIMIYAILAALCGSLVNKAEDRAKAILPVTYLSMAGYFVGLLMGMMDPNNLVIRIGSYIPFFSSYFMPIRLANDTVSLSGAAISTVILLVANLVLMLISAKMYKSNVLVYNENGVFAALKQSFALLKNEA